MTPDRILVGFDGSANATDALAWAVDEAAARGGIVEVLSIMAVPALAYGAPGYLPPSLERYRAEMVPLVEEALEGTGRRRPSGPPVELRVAEGSASVVLGERAQDDDVAVVVVGARGHGAVTEMMLGSASHALAHTCDKPLVIVPRGWAKRV